MRSIECLQPLLQRETIIPVIARVLECAHRILQSGSTVRAGRICIGRSEFVCTRIRRIQQIAIKIRCIAVVRGKRIASLLIKTRKRVVPLLKACIALLRSLLGIVVRKNVEESYDSLLLSYARKFTVQSFGCIAANFCGIFKPLMATQWNLLTVDA